MAARWWPLSRRSEVVIDPERSFGQPVLSATGVPTRALAEAVAAEGSVGKVAKLYQVPVPSVRQAVEFERRLAA